MLKLKSKSDTAAVEELGLYRFNILVASFFTSKAYCGLVVPIPTLPLTTKTSDCPLVKIFSVPPVPDIPIVPPLGNQSSPGDNVVDDVDNDIPERDRSEEHTSELQSLEQISYAVFCLKKKNFFNDTATTEIYTLSLHDALPISDIDYVFIVYEKDGEYYTRAYFEKE